ncbi:beta-ketoacyl synthase chain length factor [Affinibrenneria salicis]|uniref:Beta-ketoacyl synthase chain length factor n=1 Tax=Affinibrenneria salicis TaxID=2590031 RepID=A0A5J5G502_9GAMM|nr:beta-ketoacyl synthase chain length factor [Affinibrenneria salicis]KAA9001944.1 beta-ketoacyl synthase chain length factor [Affinibrenneria salicis]
MKLAFSLIDWQASAPGLSEPDAWRLWAQQADALDEQKPMAKCSQLPMMTARRLKRGSCAAVDCGLALLRRQDADAIVFTSRHGELERNLRILQALSRDESPSPTDFAMSVHNAAAGSLTIAAGAALTATSLAAGIDSFQQGLVEVAALHGAGYERVLLVDFDGDIPAFYQDWIPPQMPRYPYAVALMLARGAALTCESCGSATREEPAMAQSLQFMQALLAGKRSFAIGGDRINWRWTRHDG